MPGDALVSLVVAGCPLRPKVELQYTLGRYETITFQPYLTRAIRY